MNWTFLPRRRSEITTFGVFLHRPRAGTIYERRRHTADEIGRLMHFVWLFVFLMITPQIGESVLQLVYEPLGTGLAMTAEGIRLPPTGSYDLGIRDGPVRPWQGLIIIVYPEGRIQYLDEAITYEELEQRFRIDKLYISPSSATLVVDARTPMEHVLPVLQALREAEIRYVYFATTDFPERTL